MTGAEVIGTQGTLDPNAGGALPPSDALTGSSFKQEQSNQSSTSGFGSMAVPVFVGILVPILLAVAIKKKTEKKRAVAVPVDAAGEPGYTLRHERYLSLLETPWEGANSIAALFEQACEANSAGNLLGTREVVARETIVSSDGRPFEKITLGKYSWITFGEAFKKVVNFSSGLVKIGLEKGERVAIFAETRAEWFMALQACFRRNATVVTIYPSLGDDALVYSLNETEAGTVICDRKQLTKLIDLSNQLETVKRVVYMYEDNIKSEPTLTGASSNWTLEPFANVEKLGEEYPVEPEIPKSNDIAVIMYTSGSTGLPKGVMMSHGNIVATAAGVNKILPDLNSKDVYMCYLPLAHVLELVAEITLCAFGASLGYGSPLTLTDTSNKVKKGTKGDVSELQPTLMTAVPAIMDRVRDGVRKTIDAKGGIAKTLFEHAYHRRLAAFEGKWYGAIGPEKFLYDAVVFKKIRAVLGGKIRGVLSGGAPLSADTQRFMNICFGAPVIQGYGLTETCAGATFSDFRDTSVGRVGPPLPSTWIKLVNWDEGGYRTSDSPFPRGEIVIGGPCVTLGYFKNQQKTDECYKTDERGIRWFFTGDVGQFHPDGVLEIVDRRKDIVKLQHGEYVSLGKVEAVLAGSQYVDNVMLYADPTKAFSVAVVVPKQPALEAWAQEANISFDSFSDLLNKKEATSEVQKDVAKVGKQGRLEKWEVPAKIKLLSEPWTPESGLVTSALKIKREVIKKAFSEDLDKLYS